MVKYVIAKRGAGLGDILGNAALNWHLAKQRGADLIIDWTNTVYHHSNQKGNLFSECFDKTPIHGVRIYEPSDFNDYASIKNDYFDENSSLMLKDFNFKGLNKDFYAYSFFKNLNVKVDILSKLFSVYHTYLTERYVISVNFRFGDNGKLMRKEDIKYLGGPNCTKESQVEKAVKLYSKKIDKIKEFYENYKVLIFTDSKLFSDMISSKYDSFNPVEKYPKDGQALHLSKFKSTEDKIKDAVFHMWLMKNYSDCLIYNFSNFNYWPRFSVTNSFYVYH